MSCQYSASSLAAILNAKLLPAANRLCAKLSCIIFCCWF